MPSVTITNAMKRAFVMPAVSGEFFQPQIIGPSMSLQYDKDKHEKQMKDNHVYRGLVDDGYLRVKAGDQKVKILEGEAENPSTIETPDLLSEAPKGVKVETQTEEITLEVKQEGPKGRKGRR